MTTLTTCLALLFFPQFFHEQEWSDLPFFASWFVVSFPFLFLLWTDGCFVTRCITRLVRFDNWSLSWLRALSCFSASTFVNRFGPDVVTNVELQYLCSVQLSWGIMSHYPHDVWVEWTLASNFAFPPQMTIIERLIVTSVWQQWTEYRINEICIYCYVIFVIIALFVSQEAK